MKRLSLIMLIALLAFVPLYAQSSPTQENLSCLQERKSRLLVVQMQMPMV